MLKYLGIVFFTGILLSCASQRTRATCAETEYRLNSMSYSPDQRAFLEEELRQCRIEQAKLEQDDVITNKIKGSIYERFAADSISKVTSENSATAIQQTEIQENAITDSVNTKEISTTRDEHNGDLAAENKDAKELPESALDAGEN